MAIRSRWLLFTGIFRLLTLRPCELCGARLRCWRWHIETADCPTCGACVTENDLPRFMAIIQEMFDSRPRMPWPGDQWLPSVQLNGKAAEYDSVARLWRVPDDTPT